KWVVTLHVSANFVRKALFRESLKGRRFSFNLLSRYHSSSNHHHIKHSICSPYLIHPKPLITAPHTTHHTMKFSTTLISALPLLSLASATASITPVLSSLIRVHNSLETRQYSSK